ncbi:MAG: hypothetical protein ACFFB3_07110 [Candidatus Hodarchaeota archaeon]
MGEFILPFALDHQDTPLKAQEQIAALLLAIEQERSKGSFFKGAPEHIRALTFFTLPIWIGKSFPLCASGLLVENPLPCKFQLKFSLEKWVERTKAEIEQIRATPGAEECSDEVCRPALNSYLECAEILRNYECNTAMGQHLLSHTALDALFPYFLNTSEIMELIPSLAKFHPAETLLADEEKWEDGLALLRTQSKSLETFSQSLESLTDSFKSLTSSLSAEHQEKHEAAHQKLMQEITNERIKFETKQQEHIYQIEKALRTSSQEIKYLKKAPSEDKEKKDELNSQKKLLETELRETKKELKARQKEFTQRLQAHRKKGIQIDKQFGRTLHEIAKRHSQVESRLVKAQTRLEGEFHKLKAIYEKNLQLEFPSHPLILHMPIYAVDYRSEKKKPRRQFFTPLKLQQKGEKSLIAPSSPTVEEIIRKGMERLLKEIPYTLTNLIQLFKEENLLLKVDIRDVVLEGLGDLTEREFLTPREEARWVNIALKHWSKAVFVSPGTESIFD